MKVNPRTTAAFFAEVLNNGGSPHYGLGSAVEEARRFGVAPAAAVRELQQRPVRGRGVEPSETPIPERVGKVWV
jgi:hypothetical protein